MKIKGRISINIKPHGTSIEVFCEKSRTIFVKIHLTPEQLSETFSGMFDSNQEIEVNHLERIGKTHEHKTFEFKIPKELWQSRKTDKLKGICESYLTDGWICFDDFSSKNTFFEENGEYMARCIVRRWI